MESNLWKMSLLAAVTAAAFGVARADPVDPTAPGASASTSTSTDTTVTVTPPATDLATPPAPDVSSPPPADLSTPGTDLPDLNKAPSADQSIGNIQEAPSGSPDATNAMGNDASPSMSNSNTPADSSTAPAAQPDAASSSTQQQ